MEGREEVLGSSVNFAVCTWDVPPATDGLTDWRKRYHRPGSARNVDYLSRTHFSLNPAASAQHPRRGPCNTILAVRWRRTQARHTAQSLLCSPPGPPGPPTPPPSACTIRRPPGTKLSPPHPVAPPDQRRHFQAHPPPPYPRPSPSPQQNPQTPPPPPQPPHNT